MLLPSIIPDSYDGDTESHTVSIPSYSTSNHLWQVCNWLVSDIFLIPRDSMHLITLFRARYDSRLTNNKNGAHLISMKENDC